MINMKLKGIDHIYGNKNESFIFVGRTTTRNRSVGITIPYHLAEAYKLKSKQKVKITVEIIEGV